MLRGFGVPWRNSVPHLHRYQPSRLMSLWPHLKVKSHNVEPVLLQLLKPFCTSSGQLWYRQVAVDSDQCPPELLCSEEEITELLHTSKASGPDDTSTRMLKETASAIAPSLTALFNYSVQNGVIPDEWKCSNIVPIPKSSQRHWLVITTWFCSFLLLAKFLRNISIT